MKDEVSTPNKPSTVEEYIDFEERSGVRHAFLNGSLIPVPGTSVDHNFSGSPRKIGNRRLGSRFVCPGR